MSKLLTRCSTKCCRTYNQPISVPVHPDTQTMPTCIHSSWPRGAWLHPTFSPNNAHSCQRMLRMSESDAARGHCAMAVTTDGPRPEGRPIVSAHESHPRPPLRGNKRKSLRLPLLLPSNNRTRQPSKRAAHLLLHRDPPILAPPPGSLRQFDGHGSLTSCRSHPGAPSRPGWVMAIQTGSQHTLPPPH
ncbi:hypothetical protein PVAP13_5KG428128 [Panicum virgatum]|uniref:Uncharacterized protein n=1 Tax=Panicum virgatum TaxID=38727 RepID=A0A8T0SKH0_PANVG|nr:hypothetical protein PVAP13_5KG428128 [Panicum virgatum]